MLASLFHLLSGAARHSASAGPLRILALLLAVALCLVRPYAHAAVDDSSMLETKVKAASIFKFIGYVDWPPAAFSSTGTPYVIGVAGDDRIADELARISVGRSVNNRPLAVRRVAPGAPLAGLHVLFIGRDAGEQQAQMLKQAMTRNILTVTEREDALSFGSIINFRLVDGRVRFEISIAAADRSGLKISSRLLPIAISVRTPPQS